MVADVSEGVVLGGKRGRFSVLWLWRWWQHRRNKRDEAKRPTERSETASMSKMSLMGLWEVGEEEEGRTREEMLAGKVGNAVVEGGVGDGGGGGK